RLSCLADSEVASAITGLFHIEKVNPAPRDNLFRKECFPGFESRMTYSSKIARWKVLGGMAGRCEERRLFRSRAASHLVRFTMRRSWEVCLGNTVHVWLNSLQEHMVAGLNPVSVEEPPQPAP